MPPQAYDHIIETTRDGKLASNSPRAHVEDVIGRAIKSGKPIVIHLHGGLVPQQSAYGMVNHLQPIYSGAGLFPIFVVWHTGLLDAVKNAPELIKRPLFQRLLVRLLKHFVARYGAPGGKALGAGEEPDEAEIEVELAKREVGEIPFPDVVPQPDEEEMSQAEKDDLAQAVASDDDLRQEWENEVESPPSVAGPSGKGLSIDENVRAEALKEFEKPEGKAILSGALLARHAVLIGARIIRRFYRHRDHGLHTTIVEEILREIYLDKIGTEVWQFMKTDSADTFEKEGEAPERAGWLIMGLLGAEVKRRKASGEPQISLSVVGHSAGCIYAANLLNYLYHARKRATSPWYQTGFKVKKLIFLAPAVTCRILAETLAHHDDTPLFESFRMFSLSDAHEKGYYEIKVLYPGSLLYIISGLLESVDNDIGDMPLTGMQRYGREANPFTEPEVKTVWQFLRAKPKQLVWSGEQKGPGLNCDAMKHGAFDNAKESPKTVESILTFLNEP